MRTCVKDTDVAAVTPAKGPVGPELRNHSRATQLHVRVNRRDDTVAQNRDLVSMPSLVKSLEKFFHRTHCILRFSLYNTGAVAAEGNVSIKVV